MTQEELANKVGVLAKTVSKWECGKGLPDVSLLPSVAEELGVSLSELFIGKKIQEIELEKQVDQVMLEMVAQEKIQNKQKLISEIMLAIPILLLSLGALIIVSLIEVPNPVRIGVIIGGLTCLLIGIVGLCYLDVQIGCYECPNCHRRFIPSLTEYIMGPHTFVRRLLRCPNCHQKHYCRRRLGKEKRVK